MSKEDVVEVDGTIIKALPDAMFIVKLDDSGHEITGYISGKIRQNRIRIIPGDKVTIEISLYDLTKGRITILHRR